MMGPRQVEQGVLFYNFSLDAHVPGDHLLRSIGRFVDLSKLRRELAPFYSTLGRPSIDPELMVRMLIVGYCFGIRSERRLCEEVHLNLAYRWFCRLGLDGDVPDEIAMERDAASASAEYLAEFRTDVQAFVERGAVEACVFRGVYERAPISNVTYSAFVDPSGGARDAMTMAVAHLEDNIVVLDAVRSVQSSRRGRRVRSGAGELQRHHCQGRPVRRRVAGRTVSRVRHHL